MTMLRMTKWKCRMCDHENEAARFSCVKCGHEPTGGRRDVNPEGRRYDPDQQEPIYTAADEWVD
jgi:uncharacterized membrane protein YvbJ